MQTRSPLAPRAGDAHRGGPVARLAILILAFGTWTSCASPETPRHVDVELALVARGDAGVACIDPHAARVGAEVLAAGGNAVDAAVATAFALAVSWPPAGNIGGGGFLVLAAPDGTRAALDFRETAPAAVTAEHYLDERGEYDPALVQHPWHNVGVPGTVAGLGLAHARFGSLPWERLVEPAVRLAEDGLVVTENLAAWLALYSGLLDQVPASRAVFLPGGQPPRAGETWRQPDLAATLTLIRDEGPRAFYTGPVAEALAAACQAGGHPLTVDDLAAYEPRVREPLRTTYAGHEVVGMPPPSSGGVAVAQMLALLDRWDVTAHAPGSDGAEHRLAEAARRAFAERAAVAGDPDFTAVPVDALLDPAHLDALAADFSEQATPSETYDPAAMSFEGDETTHVSVMDADGLTVACTLTLEGAFGGGAVAAGTGVLLNNELRDFNRVPGTTDASGLIGTDANLPGPGKRPLSSMSPTVVVDADGVPVLATGSPGGRTIINTVARVVVRRTGRGLPLRTAVELPRSHHQWLPDRFELEPREDIEPLLLALRARGHDAVVRTTLPPLWGTLGAAHSVARDAVTGEVQAVGDARRGGAVGVVQGSR